MWFTNRSKRPGFRDNIAKRRPSVAVMVNHLFPDLVSDTALELASEAPGYDPKKPPGIRFFQPSCKQVYESLSAKNKQRVQSGIEEWTKKPWPVEVQIK